MKAVETDFLKFLRSTNQFIIPIYQRNYTWGLKQCEQLWNDIVKAATDRTIQGHFIGSIVYIESGLYQVSSVPQLLVIDGQQRLATMSLLLTALSRSLGDSKVDGDLTRKKLENYYLFNNEEEGELRYKLLLTRTDKDTLISLLDESELPTLPSIHMMENFEFFKEQISNNQVSISQLFEGIKKLMVVSIALDRNYDNPQLIFESLNSTGIDLSQADLIRNYVLMGREPKEQSLLYNQYWFVMENSFAQEDYERYFDRFMRDFLTIQTGRIPNISEVYQEFKTYVATNKDLRIEEIVKKIFNYSKLYVKLVYAKDEDSEIRDALEGISKLQVNVSYPFLMEVFNDYSKGRLQREDVVAILRLVESYVFRRAICGIPTNSLNKTFATLTKEIDKDNNYLESMKAALHLKDGYTRFPTDNEFHNQFQTIEFYNLRGTKEYAISKLENHHHKKESIDITEYTIEHIMPQNKNLSAEWQDELGQEWQRVHQEYMHRIGNLTITGYNSELGDRSFRTKRDMEGGFAHSPFFLNKRLANLDHWNEKEIQTRSKELADLAINLWPYPQLEEAILKKYTSRKESPVERVYSEDDHLKQCEGNVKQLYFSLKSRILETGKGIQVNPVKNYIAFVKGTIFLKIRVRRAYLLVDIITRASLDDPKNMVVHTWKTSKGGFSSRIRVANEQVFQDLFHLIMQTRKLESAEDEDILLPS